MSTFPAADKRLHVFVISWKGQHENALHVAAEAGRACDRVTLVYSDPDPELNLQASCQVLRRPDELFWGDKFKACLEAFAEDLMLVIQADATCGDWSRLVHTCQNTLGRSPQFGVWAPLIDWTPYSPKITQVGVLGKSPLAAVVQTDGIVMGMQKAVVDRLKKADLSQNVYGWGIDQMAVAYCYANQMIAVVDQSLPVHHPKTRGYPSEEAGIQWREFLNQLTVLEKIHHQILFGFLRDRNSRVGHI